MKSTTMIIYFLVPALIATTFLIPAQDQNSQYQYYSLLLTLSWCTFLLLSRSKPLPVLLVDYSCFRPGEERRCSFEVSEYFTRRSRRFSELSEGFMRQIFHMSGLGDETYIPPFVFQTENEATLQHAVQEAEEGMFSAVDSLLAKTDVVVAQIGVVIVACSMFSPCPSLSAHLVNHYGFHPSVKNYNLSGMGCSAGTVGVDMAAMLLRRRPGFALLVVTESTSLNWYFGDNRPMLVTNCIFRVGAAAVLLTSNSSWRDSSKMELVRTLRTHHGANDAAYFAAIQEEDDNGNVGVTLSKDLVRVAGAGLKEHIGALAPRVLPISQLLRYVYYAAKVAVTAWWSGGVAGEATMRPVLVPDFTTAFKHMCIHTGGKAVIQTVGKVMGLAAEVTEPARMALHRFGNTSSSLVYYQLAYFEAKRRIKKGDHVWMLAFGTGFKACSVVWKALRDSGGGADNPWNDCIHRYPE